MTLIPQFAPGCFGSALAYKDNESICRGCTFNVECRPLHLENKARLQALAGIKPPKVKPVELAPSAPIDPTTMNLPTKVRELLERIDRNNLNIVGHLRRGENPFVDTMPFMRIACHLLLRCPANMRLDRQLLSSAFVKKLNWQQGTAEAHARLAVQALVHVGAIDLVDGVISLRKQ